MPRLGMCSNNLNYLQNKTSRLYHIQRTYKNVKCKNKNVLGVLKSSKYISLFEPRQSVKFSCKMPLNSLRVRQCRVSQHGVFYFTWSRAEIIQIVCRHIETLVLIN